MSQRDWGESVSMDGGVCGRCYANTPSGAGPCPKCGSEDVVPVGTPRATEIFAKRPPPKSYAPAITLSVLAIGGLGALAYYVASKDEPATSRAPYDCHRPLRPRRSNRASRIPRR